MAKVKAEDGAKAPETIEEFQAALATEQSKNAELNAALTEEQSRNTALAAALNELELKHESELNQAFAINTELQNRLADSQKAAPVRGPVVEVDGKKYEVRSGVNLHGKFISAGDIAAYGQVAAILVGMGSKVLKAIS